MSVPEMALWVGVSAGVLVGMLLVWWLDREVAARLEQYCTMQVWLLEDSFRWR